jgi:pimeloyl-ACP methyl ester carboxylesterase
MKNIIISIAIIFASLTMYGQVENNQNLDNVQYSYTQYFDSIIAKNLILNRIPNKVLYNRVLPWSQLDEWKEKSITSKKHLIQTWADLDKSSYELNDNLSFSIFKTSLNNFKLYSYAPLVVFNYNYTIVDSLAISDGRLSIDSNGVMTDNNLPQIPYSNKTAKLGGLFLEEAISGRFYKFSLTNNYFMNNTERRLVSVKLFNKTTNETLRFNLNETKEYSFEKEGRNELEIEFTLDDLTTIKGWQYIEVRPKHTRAACNVTHDVIESSIPFQGYDEPEATTSYGDYHVFYRYKNATGTDCEDKLKKPVLFLDGFDALNSRDFDKIYSDYITVNSKQGDLAEKLRRNGYDLVILNFPMLNDTIQTDVNPVKLMVINKTVHNASNAVVSRAYTDGGADYIERNAMVFVALIQKLNVELKTNWGANAEKMVVIGPSMGGQISRYGLAYMEKEYASTTNPAMLHNVRNWISFDSPHEGANIAIGAQQCLNFLGNFANKQDALESFNSQIRSKAARQLLIEQMDGLNRTANFHSTYYNRLNNLNGLTNSHGYPQNLRKVTLINGSYAGQTVYNAGTDAVNVDAFDNTFNILGFKAIMKFMPNNGNSAKTFEGVVLDKFKGIKFGFPYFNSTTTTFNPTTNMSQKNTFVDFGIGTFFPPIYKKFNEFFGENTTINSNPNGSIDIMPGGRINIFQKVYDPINKLLNTTGGITPTTHTLYGDHCFIPSWSSMGFKNPNFLWSTPFSNSFCDQKIYFDGYFAPQFSEDHVHISKESSDWAFDEVQRGQLGTSCADFCNYTFTLQRTDLPLGVDKILCDGATYTYQITPAIPANANVQWFTPNNQVIVISSNNSSITFTVNYDVQSYNSNKLISVKIYNPCGAETRTTTIGDLAIPYDNSNPLLTSSCYYGHSYGYFAGYIPNTTYDWINDDGQQPTYIYNAGISCPWNTWSGWGSPIYTITVTASNVCYSLSTSVTQDDAPQCDNHRYANPSPKELDFVISPNPTSTNWKVSTLSRDYKTEFNWTINNALGSCLLSGKDNISLNHPLEINSSNIPTGFYILTIIDKQKKYKYRLIKQ